MALPSERRKAPRKEDPELRGRRSEPRALIGLRASTEMLSGRGDASLLDLSCAGAKLQGERLPAVGKDVLMTCGETEIFGTVLWSEDGRCGIAFEEPISRRAVAGLRRMAAGASDLPDHSDEAQAAADWASGLAR